MPTKFWGLGIEHETNYFVGTTTTSGRDILKIWQSSVFEDFSELNYLEIRRHLQSLINPAHQYTCLLRWDDIEQMVGIIFLAVPKGSESQTKKGKASVNENDEAIMPLVQKLKEAIAKGKFTKEELQGLLDTDFSDVGSYPEFVTSNFKRATVEGCLRELSDKEATFAKLGRLLYGTTLKQCRYGAWPFIYTSNTEDVKDKKVIKANIMQDDKAPKTKKVRLTQDYNGSYHINVTLPVNGNFYDGHLSAMKMLQWMEPLFVAAWGQPSVFSFADNWRFTEGSQRMVSNAYSRMGTRSLIKADKESSRQLLDSMKQRQSNPFRPVKKSDQIDRYVDRKEARPTSIPLYLPVVESLLSQGPNNAEEYGSDFRRGQKDPFGFEFRILDHFPTQYLADIIHVLLLVCDQSAGLKPETIPNAQMNKDWNDLAKAVLLEGWNAGVTQPQILAMSQALNLDHDRGLHEPVPRTAIGLFAKILDLLWQQNGNGRGPYTRRMVGLGQRGKKPKIVNLNKQAFDAYAHLFLAGKPSLAKNAGFEDEADLKALSVPAKSVLVK